MWPSQSTTAPLIGNSVSEQALAVLPSRLRRLSATLADWRPFARQKPLLGLDIGSHSIKAVALARERREIRVKAAALAETPVRALTQGVLTDALVLSERLRSLRAMFHLETAEVAVAAGGEKIYCQLDHVRDEAEEGFAALVENTAQVVVPYPLAHAALDYQELPAEAKGPGRAVLWVSCAAEQVDWLRQAVFLAGMTPEVVDVEACALANVFIYNHQPRRDEVSLLLHVGVRQAAWALLRGETLLYARGALVEKLWHDPEPLSLADRVVAELDRHWDDMEEQASPAILENMYVSGGPARSPKFVETLGRRLGLRAAVLEPFRRISYASDSEAGKIASRHAASLTVAVGLALRSFNDL